MWPVGLIAPTGISTPIVSKKSGKIQGFVTDEKDKSRNFPGIDMAGFAVHLSLVHSRKPSMPYQAAYEEEGFLNSLKIK